MESAHDLRLSELKKTERRLAIERWLQISCGIPSPVLQPMVGDASLRCYFRVEVHGTSFVVMDAPPLHENCHSYIAISKALKNIGLHVPEVIVAELEQGFLLITDLGNATFLNTLNTENADKLYGLALDALAVLQGCRMVEGYIIPPFTADFMWKEWAWHKEWFLGKLLGLLPLSAEKDLDHCYEHIVESAVSQPQVFMHRDYHSANLMVLPQDKVGILDFQDAFIGPVTYDLVSLLRDAYINWPQEQVRQWAINYWQKLHGLGVLTTTHQEFLRWFDLMGVQRQLKALLTFARKHVRDHQSHYLHHIPRTLEYLISVSQHYAELSALYEYLYMTVQPAFARVIK
ncbi:MAG: phosphotransferase [Gammaproteobacteria bacterium]|nr:phosphotransferase [Gammaproteobacteria bacterium]MCW5583825.1 phosphotransferase [Gammaproteobacteria bacterium]